ncbi:DUF808 domain-containing protein [Candidatus Gracilibacteria bacterium]|nr:DUF808 domain-containing protein [Candidatus Gracilibacteria bacterium]
MAVGILALLDDVGILLDDAAAMTKISIQKTAGLLGDDLAVNAKKASGFSSSRELPVIWRITLGAMKNKLIILPVAFLLTALAPSIMGFILILGGCYLAFEGAEKIHEVLHAKISGEKHTAAEIVLTEDEKVKSAVFTDFILSIEIIVIALSTVKDESLMLQIIVVSIIALIATFVVYGLVALIVRLDDVGAYFMMKSEPKTLTHKFGKALIVSLPVIIKILSIIGTLAMLIVAGGIFTHNVEFFHHIYTNIFSGVPLMLFETLLGLLIGLILVIVSFFGRTFLKKIKK